MMVRPLNAAKPATTSRRSALSHVTVMRAACDLGALLRVGREVRVDRAVALSPASRPAPLTAAAPARSPLRHRHATGAAAALAADWLDHASNAVRSERSSPHLTVPALDLIVLQRVESITTRTRRPELGVPEFLMRAVGSVVQHRRGDEARALQVHDHRPDWPT